MTENNSRQILKSIKRQIGAGHFADALAGLRDAANAAAEISVQHRLARLCASLPMDGLGLTPLKLAIVATSSVEHLADILRLYLARDGFDAEIFQAEFDTMRQSVLDPASRLYEFEPDIVWLFTGHRDVTADLPPGAPRDIAADVLRAAIDGAASLWDALRENCSAQIIQNNADLPLERVLGNFDGAVAWGGYGFLRRYNIALADATTPGVTVFDLDQVSASFGKQNWFDERYWYHSKHAFSLDAVGLVAHQAARLIGAIRGQAKKCLVLDLDDTLWGGVIGDDGLDGIRLGEGSVEGEAFVDFQRYLLRLKERGVILAVSSKNEDENARQPFMEHPAMVLRLDDIAVFRANWDNKADNIREIAATLDIGLDSLVFIDDNPAERGLVRSLLPMVAIPEMPVDPSLFIRTIDRENFMEMTAFSAEDKTRAAMYRENAKRRKSAGSFSNLDDFLRDLDMEAVIANFDQPHLPRIAQLINKTNQFNLTTARYGEAEIAAMMTDPSVICRYVTLKDRYGDNGLISLIILRRQGDGELNVDTWLMSCRVLSRNVEEFICNQIVAIAREEGRSAIIGKFIPTRKNKLVAHHYEKLGFEFVGNDDDATLWRLDIGPETALKETHVQQVKLNTPQ